MAFPVTQSFKRTTKSLRFEDDVLTKSQMLQATDDQYETGYTVIDKDTLEQYVYNANATPSQTTGKFVKSSSSGGGASLTIDTTDPNYGDATISEGGKNLSFTNQNGQGVHIGGISENGEMVTSKSYVDANSGKIDKIKVNNVEQTISNKEVDIEAVQFNGTKLYGKYTDATLSGGVVVSMDFVPTTDGMQYKTEYDDGTIHTTTKDLVDKSYVDTELAKKGNAITTFDNEYKTLQIRDVDNNLDFQIVKETSNDYIRVNEYAEDDRGAMQQIFDVNLPTKTYVDTTILSQEKTIDNDYYYTSREPSGYKLIKKNQTSNAGTGSTLTSSQISLSHNSGSGPAVVDLIIDTQENGACSVQMSDNMISAFNSTLGAGINMKIDAEKWYGTYTDENNVTYQVYTKIIYIPALPATAGITTYPMGVSNIKQILNIYGYTTDGFILNAPRQNVQDNITIYQASKGSQTFSIEVGKDRSNKSAYVTIIYAKNN